MIKHFYILALSVLISNIAIAQQRRNGHLPVARTKAEYQLMIDNAKNRINTLGKAVVFPENMRMPGEFEESRAVVISWAYEYDADFTQILGIDTSTSYGWISAQLAHYISEECEVWIRLWDKGDDKKVLTFMESLGWPLTNYRFFYQKGDDFWVRDFGPMAFYYGSKDSVGFTDMKYYDGRDSDNVFPAFLAQKMGYNNYETPLNAEGGNFMTDGYGRMVFSSVIRTANNDIQNWTTAKTYSTIKSTLASSDLQDLPTLVCDGGTGHIDLYTKFIDEETIIVSKYPQEITASDRQTIEDNYQKMAGWKSTYGRPYTIYRIPHPTGDNGKHDSLTCEQINNDARNFINGITVNNTFLFPSYSDEIDGNKPQTDSVVELFKTIMPGYRIIPIDSREMSPLGGAIHCITMQIPADNPLRIWHPKVQVNKVFQNDFKIVAKCQNYSGMKNVNCVWRKNTGTWQNFALTDSAGYHIGILTVPGLTSSDFVEYYIDAEANNGRKARKPLAARDGLNGYYRIQFENGTNVNEFKVTPKNYLFAAYPNPAKNQIHIPFQLLEKGEVAIKITDITGKVLAEQTFMANSGQQENVFDLSVIASGLYFYTLSLNGEKVSTRKFLKQ
jgi:agmatine/peptidylarginine deiminase